MCLAKIYAEQLLEIYDKINEDIKRLKKEVRRGTLFSIDMFHTIENTNFNACEGYKFAKQIKDNQISRRKAKYELTTLIQLKNNFIDQNIELLITTHKEIIDKNDLLQDLIKNKTYKSRVEKMELRENVVVTEPILIEDKPKFIPIPIPSTPPEPIQQELPIGLGDAIHKKTNAKLKVISQVDDKHHLVKMKHGYQVICSKYIVNLQPLQVAK